MGNVKRSPWLLHYDGSSCNGCDIEVLACLTPVYDAERFGIINTGDPMQADIFLITGGINKANQEVVRQLYNQMPRPKVVVAVGVCACTGGVFKECYNIIGGADTTKSEAQTPEVAAAVAEAEEVIDFSKVEVEPLFADCVDFETFSKSDFRVVKVKECVAVPKSKKLLQFTLDDGTGTDRTILSGIHEFYEPEQLVGKTLVAITNLPPRAMMGIESCGMLLSAVHSEEGEERLNLIMLSNKIPAGAKLY